MFEHPVMHSHSCSSAEQAYFMVGALSYIVWAGEHHQLPELNLH